MIMKVVFIHGRVNPHPAHEPFIKAVKADIYPAYKTNANGFKKFLEAFKMAIDYPDYDVYILEGGVPMFPMYLRRTVFKKDGIVIGLLADCTFVNLVKRLSHYSIIETLIHRISSKCLDGAIAVSNFVKSYAEKVLNIPIKVVNPAIPKGSYKKLGRVKPDLESNVIVSVGEGRYSIGMDILVKQFKIVRRELPEAELWIVGKGHPKEYERIKGVKVLGYVEDLGEVFEKASLFVHAGRSSAYPVSTLEAMRAGLPVIVTKMTGTKDVIGEVCKRFKEEFGKNLEFVKDFDELNKGIIEYFKLSPEEREYLSKEFKKVSERFEPERVERKFRDEFNRLLKVLI